MRILVTGAGGFVGRNLVEALKCILDGKDRTRGNLHISEVMEVRRDTPSEALGEYCSRADFVFHLAGVNRPEDPADFMAGNRDFTVRLLDELSACENTCPIMLASSVQASLEGRYAGSVYGESKLAGERALFDYARRTGARALVYRFPNLFGKWCRPNYNSAVATFCHNTANDLPITVSDPSIELELAYIDDVVDELIAALVGAEHRYDYDGLQALPSADGAYCYVPITHRVTLGEVVSLLESFSQQPRTLQMPAIAQGSFAKKLYSTYLSYLPPDKVAFPLKMNVDERGSFTELLRTADCGQFSVNVSKPGITKGQHWHHSKWEFFMVVSGEALIQMRRIGEDEVMEFQASGKSLQAVHMLPGYTHNIINVSDTDDLVTLMWANEPFDPNRPDTFFEEV